MITIARRKTYIPDPEKIARLAAEIHDENLRRDLIVEDEASRIDRRGGPKVLLLAVVKNAVNTLEEWGRRYDSFHGRSYEFAALSRNARLAYRFLMSEDQEFITRFRCICDVTGADAEAIRDIVRTKLDDRAIEAMFNPPVRTKEAEVAHT